MNHAKLQKLTKILKDKNPLEIQKWLITNDGIKRQYVLQDGSRSFQRLPKDWYKALDETARKDLLNRLNAEDWRVKEALERYEIQSAFIPPKTLDEFEKKLNREMGQQTAASRMQNLRVYCLEFFLPRSPNPIAWQKDLQDEWVDYLVGLDYAPSTYKHIRIALNKFMRFIATKNPDLPTLIFDGISRHQIAEIRYQRELKGLGVRRYVPPKEFEIIYSAAPDRLKPYWAIDGGYGCRRNEMRALTKDKIKKDHLLIDRQRKDDGTLTLPKHRKIRKIPHWFMTPRKLQEHIEALEPFETGAQLSMEFKALTQALFKAGEISHPYVLHEGRNWFITHAAKNYPLPDVMLAAGHSDLRITSEYLKDARELEDEAFDPTGS